MSKLLPLVIAPDPILLEISKPVTKFDSTLKTLLDDMLFTMYRYDGVGLAGVQVGVLKRVLVMDIDYEEDEDAIMHQGRTCSHVHVKNTNPRFFVNPEITTSGLRIFSLVSSVVTFDFKASCTT